ncbi:ZCHC3 protein, partial [Polypterus senegalus]
MAPLSLFKVQPLWKREWKVMTVHMFNPWVEDDAIMAFLRRYATAVFFLRRVTDDEGIWNGCRQFKVQLKKDSSSVDGLTHPPSSFSLGPNKGYLFYGGMPTRCGKCGKDGHVARYCSVMICRNCNKVGHKARDCPTPRCCHICGQTNHLYHACPDKQKPQDDEVAVLFAEGVDHPSTGIDVVEKDFKDIAEVSGGLPMEQHADEPVCETENEKQILLEDGDVLQMSRTAKNFMNFGSEMANLLERDADSVVKNTEISTDEVWESASLTKRKKKARPREVLEPAQEPREKRQSTTNRFAPLQGLEEMDQGNHLEMSGGDSVVTTITEVPETPMTVSSDPLFHQSPASSDGYGDALVGLHFNEPNAQQFLDTVSMDVFTDIMGGIDEGGGLR